MKDYINPKEIKNIVDLCNKYTTVQYDSNYSYTGLNSSPEWLRCTLVGIEKFSSSFMFIVFREGVRKYVQRIRL